MVAFLILDRVGSGFWLITVCYWFNECVSICSLMTLLGFLALIFSPVMGGFLKHRLGYRYKMIFYSIYRYF